MTDPTEEAAARPPRVVIVGGGMAGLAAAWELERWSRAGELVVDLFESSPRVGGPVVTDYGSGFALEGGPDSFLTTKPDFMEMVEELGLSNSLIGVRESAHGAYIFRAGHLHRIPPLIGVGFWSAARSIRSTTLLSRAGKLRMSLGAILVRLRPIRADERAALGPQLRSRFGREAVEWLLEPFLAGVHSTPIDLLSPSAVAAVLPARWMAAASRPRVTETPAESSPPRSGAAAPRRSPFASLREGMESLPRRLRGSLEGTRVHLRTKVNALQREGDSYRVLLGDGSAQPADGVILAVPGVDAADLLRSAGPAGAVRELDDVARPPIVVVGFVYRREDVPLPLDGTGVLVPSPTGLPITAITWLSSKWDRPDPALGGVALRAFLRPPGGEGSVRPTDEESVGLARGGLRQVMGIEASPTYSVVFAHSGGLPWYEVGHADRVMRARQSLSAWPRIELAGNAYDGIGLPDVVRSGRGAARRLVTALGLRAPSRS